MSIAFRYVDLASLQREKEALVQAKARLVQVYNRCSIIFFSFVPADDFADWRTARTVGDEYVYVQWVHRWVYQSSDRGDTGMECEMLHRFLLTHETPRDVDDRNEVTSGLTHNAISPIVLFMRPAFLQAMRASLKPRSAYVTVMRWVQIYLGSRAVPNEESICGINHGITAMSSKAYFRVWDGTLAAVLVPVLDIAARLWLEMPKRDGTADLWTIYMFQESLWKEQFFAGRGSKARRGGTCATTVCERYEMGLRKT